MAGDRGQLGQLVQAHASPTLEGVSISRGTQGGLAEGCGFSSGTWEVQIKVWRAQSIGIFPPQRREGSYTWCELVVPVRGCACQLLPLLLPDQPPLGSGPSRPACSFAPPPGAGSAARPRVLRAEAKGAAPSGPSPSAQPMLR